MCGRWRECSTPDCCAAHTVAKERQRHWPLFCICVRSIILWSRCIDTAVSCCTSNAQDTRGAYSAVPAKQPSAEGRFLPPPPPPSTCSQTQGSAPGATTPSNEISLQGLSGRQLSQPGAPYNHQRSVVSLSMVLMHRQSCVLRVLVASTHLSSMRRRALLVQ